MSKRDPRVTLRQILEHARRVQELTTATLFMILNDGKLSSAFEREMEILGEAVKRLPADLVARYPEIPWKQKAGTRDRLSHGYDETDYSILWDAACNDVPALIATVRQMLRDIDESAPEQV